MDLTTLWVFRQKNKYLPFLALLGLLLFGSGWQLGKIMSPYYAASPIVFEEKTCPDYQNGNPAAFEALKEEGIAQRQPATKTAETSPSSAPQVAGAKEETATKQRFVGSVNSDLYHDISCSSADRIKPANQVWFESIEEAETAGYSPSKCTRDKLGI